MVEGAHAGDPPSPAPSGGEPNVRTQSREDTRDERRGLGREEVIGCLVDERRRRAIGTTCDAREEDVKRGSHDMVPVPVIRVEPFMDFPDVLEPSHVLGEQMALKKPAGPSVAPGICARCSRVVLWIVESQRQELCRERGPRLLRSQYECVRPSSSIHNSCKRLPNRVSADATIGIDNDGQAWACALGCIRLPPAEWLGAHAVEREA